MHWYQIVMIIQMTLWTGISFKEIVTDKEASHATSVIAFFFLVGLLVFNIFVLSAGGFW